MILPLLRLMRIYYSLPIAAGFAVIVTYLTAGNIQTLRFSLLVSSLSLLNIISAAYVLNDVFDIEIDKINFPNRMLPKAKTTRKAAIIWAIILFLAGFIFAALSGPKFLLLLITVAAAVILYDTFSKRMGMLKDFLVAALMTSLYPLAFTLAEPASQPQTNTLYVHSCWLFLTCLGYEMLKDSRDIKGDKTIKHNGIAAYSTKPWFLPASRIIILAASTLTLLPFMLGYCNYIYLCSAAAAVILAFLSIRKPPAIAIRYIYAEIILIALGSILDLFLLGP